MDTNYLVDIYQPAKEYLLDYLISIYLLTINSRISLFIVGLNYFAKAIYYLSKVGFSYSTSYSSK